MPSLRLLLLQLCVWAPAEAIQGDGPPGTEDYYWPKRAGTYIGHGAMPFDVPLDFSSKPAWIWDNPDDELYRHGPVIDGEKNIYVVTGAGWIRKFDPNGSLIWSWRASPEEGKIVTSPFLHGGLLYLSSTGPGSRGYAGLAHCFDMKTGKRLWARPLPLSGFVNADSSTVHVAEGVVLGGMVSIARPWASEGNNMIWAMNATDGGRLWEFTLDEGVVWNFMPSTPGDGTFLFATSCGRAERRRLSDGSAVWKSPLRDTGIFCSTGGATLGPDGVLYVEASHRVGPETRTQAPPLPGVDECTAARCPSGPGLLVAYRAEDGEVLWARRIQKGFGGWQYPCVGRIGGRLVVVAGIGDNPWLASAIPGEPWIPFVFKLLLGRLQYRLAVVRRFVCGVPVRRNAVAAYDARTGEQLWLWEEEPWGYWAAAGDEETLWDRIRRSQEDPRRDSICGPDNWGIPAITADGTVLAGSGSTGKLYAIRDADGDGRIGEGEVKTFETGQGFLNGPALAPGMMAVAPCWGPMYVFKSAA